MRTVGLALVALALSLTAASGQAPATTPDFTLTAGKMLSDEKDHLVASGGVTVTIGSVVITADGADVRFAEPGKPSDITLSGTVRVKAVIR